MRNQLLANSKGHLLKEHLIAVSNVGREMGQALGLPAGLTEDIWLAGLLHDFGKATKLFQKYMKKLLSGVKEEQESDPKEMVLHHELSWAYWALKIDREKYFRVLCGLYWHHARPLNEDYEMHENTDDILIGQDTKPLDKLRKELNVSIDERPIDEEVAVPALFRKDSTGDRNGNAEMLAVRGCLITADRFVSSLESPEVSRLANNIKTAEAVSKLLAGGISGYSTPAEYDPARFSIQEKCAGAAMNHKTVQVNAPAGFGKTVIGLLWGSLHGRKLIWVCPRNVVAQAVYGNILKEMKALSIACSLELYLTGRKQESFGSDGVPDFGSDIVVTNIDNLLSPLINNSVSERLFSVMGGNVVFDEYHEFIGDTPLFSAFITLMRVRHRLSCNAKTMLLSATPTNMRILWDMDDDKTVVLPEEGRHYPPAHEGSYQVRMESVPETLKAGSLTIYNSIKNAQNTWQVKGATYLAHSSYTDTHRKLIMETILSDFGKSGKGVAEGKNVVAAPIVQAAMDVSFSELTESLCSPESTLQRIGRCDRWGTLRADQVPCIRLVDLHDDASERGAINTTYNWDLRNKWVDFLREKLKGEDTITLREWYGLYHDYYKKAHKEIHAYLLECYKKGLESLTKYYPLKLFSPGNKPSKTIRRSLRNPDGSYFFTVKTTLGAWLGPDDVMSEGEELLQRYLRDGELNMGLLKKVNMQFILKKLVDAGFSGYQGILKRDRVPNDVKRWFRLARNPDTPLPDISRTYHVKDDGETIQSIGKGLIKKQ